MVVPRDDSVFLSAQNAIANTSFVAWKLAKCALPLLFHAVSHAILDVTQSLGSMSMLPML